MSTLGGPPKKGGSTLGGPPKQSGSTLGAPPKQGGGSTLGGPPKQSGSTLGAPPKQGGGSTLGGPPKQSGSTLGAPPKQGGSTLGESPKQQESKLDSPQQETLDKVENTQENLTTEVDQNNNVENDEAPKESASKKKKKKAAKKTSAPAPAPAPKKGGKRSALAEKIKKQLEEKERAEREERERIEREEEEERLRLEQLKKEEEERERIREEKRRQQRELEKLRKEQQKKDEIERKRQEVLARYSSGVSVAAPKKMSFKKKTKKKVEQQTNNNVEKPEAPKEETSTTETQEQKTENNVEETEAPKETTEKQVAPAPTETPKEDSNLRSPICCVLGHVDAGKTKLLDKMRNSNVQEGEIGGITQQIGATFFPIDTIQKMVSAVESKSESKKLSLKVPGLLVMDTPGHASFSNLRMRGTSICDIAILVVDIHSGLQQQTIESIKMLRMKKTPFIVAVNKVDRLYGWKSKPYRPIREALKDQESFTIDDFNKQINNIIAQFANEKLNAQLYYKFKSKKDFTQYFSLVPVSAATGEGVPDLIMLLIQFSQMFLKDRLIKQDKLQCSVLEVKVVEGLGTTIDVILTNGSLRRNDKIMLCGLNGPIVTTIRALKTPPPLSEIRVKSKLKYTDNNEVFAALSLKIVATGLEGAIAGSQVFVINKENEDQIEELEEKIMEPLESLKKRVEQSSQGVYVQASSLGSLEALLDFLKTECDIPVSKVGIGPLHKKDLMTALALRDAKEEFGCILAFDIKVSNEIREMAEKMGVRIFEADVIYHLQDMYKDFLDEILEKRRQEEISKCYFPCILKILPQYIIHKAKPVILGVRVLEGDLKLNSPFAVWSESRNGWLELGRVFAIEKDNKELNEAKAGDEVAVSFSSENNYEFGRQFDEKNKIVSVITRESLDLLKIHFKDYCKENLKLLFKLRNTFVDGKSGSWSIGE